MSADVLNETAEAEIVAMVERFYDICLADELLGPMFRAEIPDLEEHRAIVADFWSHSLLGTKRYQRGSAYAHHVHLKVVEEHFTRWLAAFAQATSEKLSPVLADKAMKRARHMTQSFRYGLLPLGEPTGAQPA